jgi:glycosyltransferase involved in cell wall biosynthesis
MRVAFDATALGSGRGGDETYLKGVLAGLDEVAAPGDVFPLFLRPGVRTPAGLDAGRFPARELSRAGGGRRLAFTLPRQLAAEEEAPDVLHALTHAPLRVRVPVALTVTDLSFLHHPGMYPATARARLNMLVPRQVASARVVLTLTEFCKQDLVSAYGLEPERVHVVPCTVTAPGSDPDRTVTEQDEGWLRSAWIGGPFLLYLGNLHPRKNVTRLIRAFGRARAREPRLARQQLVIAGARWWRGGPEEREAATLPAGSVVFLGPVGEAAKERLLRCAEALAYPSIFEGFGLPPLEAMVAGTPVLAGRAAAIPEVLGDAALLVDPLDVEEIADGLVRLLTEPDLRDELARRGLERAAMYTPRRTGEAARAAFAAALGSRSLTLSEARA